MIEYQYNKIDFVFLERKITNWLETVVCKENGTLGEIGYIFCDDEFILGINRQFLQHDTYTDILTFPISESTDLISGEIYISVDRVRENSVFSSNDFSRELYRVMVHGILHLLGYNDKTQEEQKVMRGREDYYLSLLN